MEAMKNHRKVLGQWGEDLAAGYLVEKGYTILERNVRTRYGEIDLIARQPIAKADGLASETIVFIEVKARASETFGMPEESINARKREHLLAAAQVYMQAHAEADAAFRMDVISIQAGPPGQQPIITHFEDAIRC